MGRVVVAALADDSLAATALRMEGVAVEEVVLDDEYDYGVLLDRLWLAREKFVLLEHDIIPWPGAVEKLMECPYEWCVHEYPLGPKKVRWALGCIKVSGTLCQRGPRYREVKWNQLDAAVVTALLKLCPGGPHVHSPPFAHVK